MARMEERMEERVDELEEKMEERVEEKVEERVEKMKVQMKEEMEAKMEKKEEELRKELASKEEVGMAVTQGLRDLPYLTLCVYQDAWTSPSSTITYDSFLTNFNNGDRPGGADGQLDLGTGVFTCLSDGIYSITYSGYTFLKPEETVRIWIYVNGVQLLESIWYAYTEPGTIGGRMSVPGSRSLVSVHLAVPPTLTSLLQMLPLQLGDTLELRTTDCTGYIGHLSLCIELSDQALSTRP